MLPNKNGLVAYVVASIIPQLLWMLQLHSSVLFHKRVRVQCASARCAHDAVMCAIGCQNTCRIHSNCIKIDPVECAILVIKLISSLIANRFYKKILPFALSALRISTIDLLVGSVYKNASASFSQRLIIARILNFPALKSFDLPNDKSHAKPFVSHFLLLCLPRWSAEVSPLFLLVRMKICPG